LAEKGTHKKRKKRTQKKKRQRPLNKFLSQVPWLKHVILATRRQRLGGW
jgi:hypothetical protein